MGAFVQVNSDPPILKAKVIDLESVFEYLNLSDICAIGETCKTLQCISGCYFNEKYPAQELDIFTTYKKDIVQKVNQSATNFAPFAKRLEICVDDEQLLPYVAVNVNENVKAIAFRTQHSDLNLPRVKDILKNVEYIEFRDVYDCTLHPENLTFCENLNYFNLNIYNPKFFANHHCPTLETLEIKFNYEKSSSDLIAFLKTNPQIKRLSMKKSDTNFMLDIIDEAKPNLHTLSIYTSNDEPVQISDRLNHLHGLGYFKRLTFSGNYSSFLDDISKVSSLTSLFICSDYSRESRITEIGRSLSEMENFVDFNIVRITKNEAEILSKCLTNIEEINLFRGTLDMLAIFARRLPKLKMASCSIESEYVYNNDMNLSLEEVNGERAKLPNARKLIIYVGDDDMFQQLRWKFIDLSFDYLEIRSAARFCHYE